MPEMFLANFKDTFLLVGVGFFALSIYYVYKKIKFYRGSELTTGKIVGWEKSETQHGFRHPLVEFSVSKNKKIKFRSSVGANKDLYAIGDEVQVRFMNANPKDAEINKKWVIWFEIPIFAIFSIAFIWMAIYFSR